MFERFRERAQGGARGIGLEHPAHHLRLRLLGRQRAGRVRRGLRVSIPERSDAAACHHALPEPVQLAARHAFGDFRALEFGDRAEHRHGELVLRLVDVLLAVDDNVLLVEQHLADDDRLVDHGARNTVCREEIDHVEDVGPQIPPQLLQGRAIHAAAGVAVVDVLFDQHVTGGSDLPSQLGDLAFDRPLLFLRIRAHPRVQCRPLHIPESIPQLSERVESDSGLHDRRQNMSNSTWRRRIISMLSFRNAEAFR